MLYTVYTRPHLQDDERIDVWAALYDRGLGEIRLVDEQVRYSGSTLKMRTRSIGYKGYIMSGSFTDHAEDLVLKWLLTTGTATRPTQWFVGLFTAAPGETGGGTEVNGNGYARQAVTFTVSGTSPTVAANSGEIEFDTATGSWGTITHVAVFDAATNGNMITYAELDGAMTIREGDVFRIPTGDLDITLD